MELDEIYNNFNSVYKTKILPNLAPYERKRRLIENKYKILKILPIISLIMPFVILTILAYLSVEEIIADSPIIDIIIAIIFLVFLSIYVLLSVKANDINTEFRNSVKKNILPIIFSLFGDFKAANHKNYCYDSSVSYINIDEIKSLNLFKFASLEDVDDYIEGYYKDSKVYITETKLEHYYDKNKILDFKGLVVKAKLNKNYKGKTIITDKYLYDAESNGDLEEIHLEDVEFEKLYNIYSNDQVEVRYLLDLGFMEKIKQARDIFNCPGIHFAIADDIFYIFINSRKNRLVNKKFKIFESYVYTNFHKNDKDYFEIAEIEKSIYDIDRFRRVCFEFVAIFKIIEYLNLVKEDKK